MRFRVVCEYCGKEWTQVLFKTPVEGDIKCPTCKETKMLKVTSKDKEDAEKIDYYT